MEKQYDHKKYEPEIINKWEESQASIAKIDPKKKPYTIVLPPPNASGKMHTGNVLMIAIEDILIRWKRMQGYSALWLPGTDHAGFETQITYERELSREGKSRFDYDRKTFYQNIWDFVMENKGLIEDQIKRMGASIDWSRYTFTLDPKVVSTVYQTFEKMHQGGLVYRGDYLVNFCPKCGTTFADLEIDSVERADPLYYVKYPLVGEEGKFVVIATTRPETIYADVCLAVNPKDKKKKELVGKKVLNPLNGQELPIVSDPFVDPDFGTGVVKITPAHDKDDYQVGLKLAAQIPSSINWEGRMTEIAGKYQGLKVKEARLQVGEELQQKGFMEKIDDKYSHSVSVCYKGGHDIEPMIMPNWFVRVEKLKKPALEAVKKGEVKIFPKWREITYIRWMEEMRDWPISRQVVWGIRIPVWYKVEGNKEKIMVNWVDTQGKQQQGNLSEFINKGVPLQEIENGLQRTIALPGVDYVVSVEKPKKDDYLPETDTFDTWFSSGQWPLVTLGYPDSADFKYFYPTSVLETGWEIIRLWVSRMIMFGIYLTGNPPFKEVYLHGMVRALDGKKMSKSLGNVINPEEYQEQYGTDALRMGLISGTANGKDFAFPRDKVIAFRNFANKLWNMARFMLMMIEELEKSGKKIETEEVEKLDLKLEDKEILKSMKEVIKDVNKNLGKYRFSDAADEIYQFMWHEVADKYIEQVKTREDKEVALSVLMKVFSDGIKILHPFMPFVTEAVWENLPVVGRNEMLVSSSWPKP